MTNRPCTCHPDDNPPTPCAEKYAMTECQKETTELNKTLFEMKESMIDFENECCPMNQFQRSRADVMRAAFTNLKHEASKLQVKYDLLVNWTAEKIEVKEVKYDRQG